MKPLPIYLFIVSLTTGALIQGISAEQGKDSVSTTTESSSSSSSSSSATISTQEEDFLQNVDISREELIARAESEHYHVNDSFNDHKYYKSQFRPTGDFWVDLDKLNETSGGIVRENSLLANSYREADTISLRFKFPFYGHEISNITIATGGFLYTGDHVHSWLAATHYIAPLMANFDLRRGQAEIKYADNGTALIVEWSQVYLNESSRDSGGGPFSFQAIIHSSGDIVFAYKSIALNISHIEDKAHPVKVGLSDAYTIDKSVLYVRRKTIYEYHRVNLRNASISNSSAIIFKSLPTCNIQRDCESCTNFSNEHKKEGSKDDDPVDFKCTWCPSLSRCSDGMDRDLQNWMAHSCHKSNVSQSSSCGLVGQHHHSSGADHVPEREFSSSSSSSSSMSSSSSSQPRSKDIGTPEVSHIVHADLVVIILVCLLVCLVTLWFAYAYFYPHTWSGQLLIKYRPTRWHWGRSEPRYTAASIHM
eukprot:TRINITY_DN1626_c0_g2_i1.p1 TRINITY_DN1626_c0_g2~~TRINITY_DN1626_c0_g2_i1.p1  ORF type:complete len:477 (+),score=135.36 TRINITY_DN1626_c0_g2_i1:123-1553(+)